LPHVWSFHIYAIFCSGPFDFLLGFSGITVVPRTVLPSILMFLSKVYVSRDPALTAFKTTFCHDARLGTLTPVNLIYRDVDGATRSKQIVYSNVKTRIWGLSTRCGNRNCDSLPGNIVYRTRAPGRGDHNHDYVACTCRECKWKSPYVQRPEWLETLGQSFFFMHDYPLNHHQRDTFTSAMVAPAPPRSK
jgi:hypothetical protein